MASRQSICYQVLKNHGLLISYSGKSLGKVKKSNKKKETFAQWKKRVLGAQARDVLVFTPIAPSERMLVANLRNKSGGEHIQKIFEAFGRHKDGVKESSVTRAKTDVYERYSNIPKETLESVVKSFNNLEPSLSQFFNSLLSSTTGPVDTEELLKDLVKGYNNAVRLFREKNDIGSPSAMSSTANPRKTDEPA